jgi:hypothetical protein
MNPITQTKNLMKINDRELEMGVAGTKNSWHQEYKVTGFFYHYCSIFEGLKTVFFTSLG